MKIVLSLVRRFMFISSVLCVPVAAYCENSNELVEQDFVELYQRLKVAHPGLYANVEPDAYDRKFATILREIRRADSRLEQWALFQSFLAFGGIAHARIDFPMDQYSDYREKGGKGLPFYLAYSDGAWRIDEDFSERSIPNGALIMKIGEKPIGEVEARMRAFISADTPELARSLLEFQFPAYYWLLTSLSEVRADSVKVTYSFDGSANEVNLKLIDRKEFLRRQAISKSSKDKKGSSNLREAKLLSDGTAWLRPGPFYNAESPENPWDTEAFHKFIDDAFETFNKAGSKNLIIDLRRNPGGDSSFSDHLVSWIADRPFSFASKFRIRSSAEAKASNLARMQLAGDKASKVSIDYDAAYSRTPFGEDFDYIIPKSKPHEGKRFTGRVAVLTDNTSYSNAVSVAAIVQDYQLGLVVGESTADYATTYGSMETFELKNTNFVVGFPKALIVRPSGDETPGPVKVDFVIPKLDSLSEVEISGLVNDYFD